MNSQNVSLSSKRRDPKSHPITSYKYMEVSVWSWGYPKLHHPCDFQIHSKPSSIIQHHPAIRQHHRVIRVIRGKPTPPLAHPGCATAPAHARCRWPGAGSRIPKNGVLGDGYMDLPHMFPGKKGTSHDKPWFWSLTIKPLFCQDCLLFSLFGGYIADSNIFKL